MNTIANILAVFDHKKILADLRSVFYHREVYWMQVREHPGVAAFFYYQYDRLTATSLYFYVHKSPMRCVGSMPQNLPPFGKRLVFTIVKKDDVIACNTSTCCLIILTSSS